MFFSLRTPLKPKRGGTLRVLSVERISTVHQDEKSLEDQQQQSRQFIAANFDGPVEWTSIASQGSGEILDRSEVRELEDRIASGDYDVVIVEDLGRICRRTYAVIICEQCEDTGTRLLALNDSVDTFDDTWKLSASFATLRHEKYSDDTAKRIRRSHRNRFVNGGVFQCAIYGYLKPPGAKSDADIKKDPEAEAVYDTIFTKLEDGVSFSEVADWLNEEGVPVGPYSRSQRWTCKSVAATIRNPIVKGQRVRNERMSRRINKTGKRISVKAPPEERLVRECPHLAFIEPARFDRVIRKLKERNACYRRGKATGIDPRAGVSRKRTKWPGQHVRCGVCGRILVYQGSKDTAQMMCSGATAYRCWNSISLHGPTTARIIAARVLAEIENLPGFPEELLDSLHERLADRSGEREARRRQLDQQIARLDRELHNLMSAIRELGGSKSVYAEIEAAESQRQVLQHERDEVQRRQDIPFQVPDMATIIELARSQLAAHPPDSQEFARLMRRLIPEVYVFPYRLIDRGHPELRAHVRFNLGAIVESLPDLAELERHLSSEFVVDLFDPPQRVEFRTRVWELTHSPTEKLTEREIGARLGITQPAVQYAKALQRRLDEAGRSDPYVPLREPPADYAKLRRYKHKRFVQEPLAGFPREWPSD